VLLRSRCTSISFPLQTQQDNISGRVFVQFHLSADISLSYFGGKALKKIQTKKGKCERKRENVNEKGKKRKDSSTAK
jgi:hypothetical protein